MKRNGMLVVAVALVAVAAWASTMRPSVIVHGQVRDAYGVRLLTGADVSCYLATQEVARTVVGPEPDGLNYRLVLDVHDPVTAGAGEVKPGDLVQIRVQMAGTNQAIIGPSTFTVSGDGTPHRADFTIGTDSDGDGLPDAWEQMVIANSGGAATNLAGVGPGQDLDGDGMTDDQEFWYGSFAFLAGDGLEIDRMSRVSNRTAFTFLTVPGANYRVETASSLKAPVWTQASIATNLPDMLAPMDFTGNGSFMTFFLTPASTSAVFRLRAK